MLLVDQSLTIENFKILRNVEVKEKTDNLFVIRVD